jgi:hypothetical protein
MSARNRERHAAHAAHASRPAVGSAPAEAAVPVSVVTATRGEERSGAIRLRAYGLWERAGRPDGEAARERFWCEAEKDLAARASS